MSAPRKLRILHFEDDNMFSELLGMTFRRAGLEVELLTIDTAPAFWAAIEKGGVDIVISDSALPGCEGLAVLRQLRARSINLPVVFLSGAIPLDGTDLHLAAGATEYLVKDDLPRVVDCIRSLSTTAGAHAARPTSSAVEKTPADRSEATSSEWTSLSRLLIHDVRNPLWRIQGFAELLRDEYGSALGDGGGSLLDEVLQGAEELKRVLDVVRRLVEVSAAPISLRVFDFSKAAEMIASRIAPSRVVEWRVEAGLEVDADAELMTLALENLLSNAFKFTAQRAVARVEVGALASQDQDERVFFVRDNGVGFDPAQRSRLFAPFYRPRTAEADPGVGIGLTLVERIMQRHGGRVWCEGALDAGATFFLGFPQRR